MHCRIWAGGEQGACRIGRLRCRSSTVTARRRHSHHRPADAALRDGRFWRLKFIVSCSGEAAQRRVDRANLNGHSASSLAPHGGRQGGKALPSSRGERASAPYIRQWPRELLRVGRRSRRRKAQLSRRRLTKTRPGREIPELVVQARPVGTLPSGHRVYRPLDGGRRRYPCDLLLLNRS